jgi:hypothetical protein
MNDEDRMGLLKKLLDQQHALRTVVEAANLQAELAKSIHAHSFAFSIYMLCECLKSYSKELSKFVREYVGESTDGSRGGREAI